MKKAYAFNRDNKTLLIFLLGVVGLLIASLLAMNRQFSSLEVNLLEKIYNLPEILQWLVYAMTQAGNIGVVLAVVAVALATKRNRLAGLLAVNASLTYLIVIVLKQLVSRPRPAVILPEIVVRLEYATGFGFPSGHTAIATALALTLRPYTPKKYRWLLWLWIGGVAFSRLYLGVHAPLDVIGGFCVGVLVVYGTRMIAERRQ